MRKIFFLLTLLCALVFKGYAQDSTTPQPVDTPRKVNQPATAPAALSSEDSARRMADSLSFMASYEYQKAHPAILYQNKGRLSKTMAGILGFLIIMGIGLYLFRTTNLCKDLSYDPATNEPRPVKDRPYSYSRVQLFWWTTIVLGCYVSFFIYAPFDEIILALNPTAVILLGGGLATSIFGRVMDNNQIARDNDNSEPDVPVRHQDIEATKGLFLDIMSDEGGITIHRFQAVIFNLVFGIAFLNMFFAAMNAPGAYPFPDFETWQLTLLGISAAGYLGLKANENGPETIERRQVEAVKKNDPNPPGGGGGAVVDGGVPPAAGGATPPVVTKAANESLVTPKLTTNAFEIMKAKLHAKGMIHH